MGHVGTMLNSVPRPLAAALGAVFVVVATFALISAGGSHQANTAHSTQLASSATTCTTVTALDVDKFVGTWYQVVNNAYTTQFGGGSSCTAAQYTKSASSSRRLLGSSDSNGSPSPAPPLVDVNNGNVHTCNATTPGVCDDFETAISGHASIINDAEPGQLNLQLYPIPIPLLNQIPVSGTYWVCKTGPEVSSQYSYLIISDEDGKSLYVLARNDVEYFASYHDDVMAYISTSLSYLAAQGTQYEPIVNSFGECPN